MFNNMIKSINYRIPHGADGRGRCCVPVRPESSASTIEGAARQPLVGGLSREQRQTPAENIAYFYSDVATPPAGHCGPARGCKGPAGAAHRRGSSQGELRTGQTGRKQPFTEVQL